MGKKPFVVKALPDPVPEYQGVTSTASTISKGSAMTGDALIAKMPFDFNFTGINVSISQFTLTVVGAGKMLEMTTKGSGNLTMEMKVALGKLKSGDKVIFENIKCSFAGDSRVLPTISLKVQ
jgi:hypothetical protein